MIPRITTAYRFRVPAHYFKIYALNSPRDFVPLILLLNPLFRYSSGGCSCCRIRYQETQHLFEVLDISRLEEETGAIDHFPIFWNVAGKDAHTGAHGFQERERQALQIGG